MSATLIPFAIFGALAVADAALGRWSHAMESGGYALVWLIVWARERENARLRKTIGDLSIDLAMERRGRGMIPGQRGPGGAS